MKFWQPRNRHPSEATLARKKAEADLEKTRAETALYRALGESLRELRAANHFGEHIAAALSNKEAK